jgi:copper chaperone CopZ
MRDKIVLHVKGMDCVGCELNVVRTLEDLDGVQKAEASYPEKKAVVHYNGEVIDPQQMCQALFKIGFFGSPSEP